jgi:dolichol-phosphate mannosyltransferase
MKLSVLIPVYNEQATIALIIKRVQAAILPPGVEKEIVIVNDGSTDGTKEILERLDKAQGIKIIHQHNQGKTGALLTALKNAQGDVFLVQDADLEYDPAEYARLIAPILNQETQVVYGSRFLNKVTGAKTINVWANGVSNYTLNLLYGTQVTDVNTCYKVFTRQAYEGITITGKHFDLDTELTVKLLQKGLSIKEVPISYAPRSRAEGKKIKWSTALSMFWMIIKHRI